MYFHNPDERAVKELLPGIRARTFWGQNMLLSLVELDAGAVLPNHSHPHEQSSYVLSGELHFTVGAETKLVKAGEVVIIPGDVEHSATVGPEPARVLDTFSPVREDYKY
jgi:quercetin dioxygenase-like cupin family protein